MDNNFTFVSFNMKKNAALFGHKSWKNRVELITQIILDSKADVIGTQELTPKTLDDIKTRLPQYECVGVGNGGKDKGEHTAIFFKKDKFLIAKGGTFWLSNRPNSPSKYIYSALPRTCTHCILQCKTTGRYFKVYNTHLDHLSALARKKGLWVINNHILKSHQAYGYFPVVLMGDFNSVTKSSVIKNWKKISENNKDTLPLNSVYDFFASRPSEAQITLTYHQFTGKILGSPIDHIFTTTDWVVSDLRICRDNVNNHYPSDHYPVVAKLTYLWQPVG